jgi:hypothetical protein
MCPALRNDTAVASPARPAPTTAIFRGRGIDAAIGEEDMESGSFDVEVPVYIFMRRG